MNYNIQLIIVSVFLLMTLVLGRTRIRDLSSSLHDETEQEHQRQLRMGKKMNNRALGSRGANVKKMKNRALGSRGANIRVLQGRGGGRGRGGRGLRAGTGRGRGGRGGRGGRF